MNETLLREKYRKTDGTFGHRPASESGVDPTATPPKPTNWRDWWPDTVGEEPIEAGTWLAAAEDSTWLNHYNATPQTLRRPLELVHGSPQPELNLDGPAHFGDLGAAMDRLYNTVDFDDLETGNAYLHTYTWDGDLNPNVMPDGLANLVMHPDHPFGNDFYDRLENDLTLAGIDDVEAHIDEAVAYASAHPDEAVLYSNQYEGTADGFGVSAAVDGTSAHLRHVATRRVEEDDLEWISG